MGVVKGRRPRVLLRLDIELRKCGMSRQDLCRELNIESGLLSHRLRKPLQMSIKNGYQMVDALYELTGVTLLLSEIFEPCSDL